MSKKTTITDTAESTLKMDILTIKHVDNFNAILSEVKTGIEGLIGPKGLQAKCYALSTFAKGNLESLCATLPEKDREGVTSAKGFFIQAFGEAEVYRQLKQAEEEKAKAEGRSIRSVNPPKYASFSVNTHLYAKNILGITKSSGNVAKDTPFGKIEKVWKGCKDKLTVGEMRLLVAQITLDIERISIKADV